MSVLHFMRIKLLVYALTIAASPHIAHARVTLEGVHVLSEPSGGADPLCDIKRTENEAAVAAAVRASNIPVIAEDEADRHIRATLATTSTETSPGACATSFVLKFGSVGCGPYRKTDKMYCGMIELCTQFGVLIGPIDTLQSRLGKILTAQAAACITQVEDLARDQPK